MQKRLMLAVTAGLVLSAGGVTAQEPSQEAVECPNPYGGGACLGPLDAGSYATRVFETPFSYTVPEGWANYEDEPGNFLLIPPGGTLDGVDAGTSDYLGVYQGVALANPDCTAAPGPAVRQPAAEMATTLAEREGLVVSEPAPVQVGGLSGYVIDIVGDPESDAACRVDDFPHPFVPLTIGAGPASLEHVQVSDLMTTRLYLLDHGETNIVIEVSDVTDAGGTADDYVPVIESIEFSTASS